MWNLRKLMNSDDKSRLVPRKKKNVRILVYCFFPNLLFSFLSFYFHHLWHQGKKLQSNFGFFSFDCLKSFFLLLFFKRERINIFPYSFVALCVFFILNRTEPKQTTSSIIFVLYFLYVVLFFFFFPWNSLLFFFFSLSFFLSFKPPKKENHSYFILFYFTSFISNKKRRSLTKNSPE